MTCRAIKHGSPTCLCWPEHCSSTRGATSLSLSSRRRCRSRGPASPYERTSSLGATTTGRAERGRSGGGLPRRPAFGAARERRGTTASPMRPPLSAAPLPRARCRCRSRRYALAAATTLRQASRVASAPRHKAAAVKEKPREGVEKRERRARSEAREGERVREGVGGSGSVDGKLRGVGR